MYRLAVYLLTAFCLTLLVAIVAVVVWRDYQRSRDVSPVRALNNLFSSPIPARGSDVEISPRPWDTPVSLAEIRSELLYLINSERVLAQVPPLEMGFNASAQQHTDSMMSYGYRSHWDIYGLTPQMRYSLAGGTNRVRQNIAGPVEVPLHDERGQESWRVVIREMHGEFMSRPAERANLLDPWHRKVSLGLSCDSARCWQVQQYETDHLEFSQLPGFSGTTLVMEAEFREGLELDALAVWYHPHPRRLPPTATATGGNRLPLSGRPHYPKVPTPIPWWVMSGTRGLIPIPLILRFLGLRLHRWRLKLPTRPPYPGRRPTSGRRRVLPFPSRLTCPTSSMPMEPGFTRLRFGERLGKSGSH